MIEAYLAYFLYGVVLAVLGVAWARPPLPRAVAILVGFPLAMLSLGFPVCVACVVTFGLAIPVAVVAPAWVAWIYFRDLKEEVRWGEGWRNEPAAGEGAHA